MAKNPSIDKINGNFKGKDILSIDQFTTSDLTHILSVTHKFKSYAIKHKPLDLLKGSVTTLLFYEPSSRTFGSFCSAVQRLGGGVVPMQMPQLVGSVAKGETLEDTIQAFQSFSEAIVIRHPQVGSAKIAADIASVPILNAGDGKGEHPTQALLDIYTIKDQLGRLDNLTVVIGGDMYNGRTVHSLIRALALYKNNTVYLLSPKQLRLPNEEIDMLSKRGINLIPIEDEKDIPKNADIWYWTRVQKERFENEKDYEKLKNKFIVTKNLLNTYGNKNMILMHPLPRVGEITTDIDGDFRAMYLRAQMKNGLYIRMALLALILGKIS